MATDPVCGMEVDPATAKYTADYHGQHYYFCSESCRVRFSRNPEAFLDGSEAAFPK